MQAETFAVDMRLMSMRQIYGPFLPTQQQAKQLLANVGISFRKAYDRDFRVCPQHESEVCAYYTDDIVDAIYTGLKMAEMRKSWERK